MPSVALVVLDTLRYDAFTEQFDWLPGTRFGHCYATSHWTVPTHASLFTGRYASEVDTHAKSPTLTRRYPTLGSVTDDHTTRFYSANPQMAYHDGWTEPFDDVMSPWEVQQPDSTHLVDWGQFAIECDETGLTRYAEAAKRAWDHDGPTLQSLWKGYKASIRDHTDVDDSGASAIRDRIRTVDAATDEFLFVNLMEAHSPYEPPESYRTVDEQISPAFVDRWRDTPDETRAHRAYDASVDYLSDVYEEIFTSLRQTYDAVVTVVDHGELLGEHGHWNHVYGLYPELTRVPLVISGVDVPSTNTEQVVSLLDVHRTVAELLGVTDETDGRGRSLLEPLDPRPQYTEFHGLPQWTESQLERAGVADKYDTFDEPLYGVVTPDGRYGYQSVDGPRGDLPEAELRELIDEFTETVPTEFDATDDAVDDAVHDRLEDLGYA